MTGNELADLLQQQGYKIKQKTSTQIVVLVVGNRLSAMKELALKLHNLGAVIDNNAKGSQIGAVLIGKVKVLVKSDGKTGGLDVESAAIESLQTAINGALSQCGEPITIKMKHRTVSGIVGVKKTAGTPKQDFHLIDETDAPVIFISHKKGSKPSDFQQWGGMTETVIANHPDVKQFVLACRAHIGPVIQSGASYFRKIPKPELKMLQVFGVNALTHKRGGNINSVDVLIQGDPGLKHLTGNTFELTGTGHVNYYGDIPDGGFEPVMTCIYKGDRDQFGIKGARFSIYPYAGRKFKEQI